jgi:hypothetical protein
LQDDEENLNWVINQYLESVKRLKKLKDTFIKKASKFLTVTHFSRLTANIFLITKKILSKLLKER